ncbi:N-acetyltransferase [Mycolicibacterium sp.]|uniref:GNAT family N-acetyltransferase n=1 Tax=Mycolicibacterium sp. TaxID=2320850 RepID=UPI0028AC6F98|nr:N-acetyltransferase [Mycolicibacterium sp.]
MIIRPERASDIDAIAAITSAAFLAVPQSRQTEAAVIGALRTAGALAVSLVAVDDDGTVIGHVAVSPLTVDGRADSGWYGGGPLSVRPDRQGNGIGGALVRAAVERLAEIGAWGCVVVGDSGYYSRFGAVSSPVVLPGVPAENVLVLAVDGAQPGGAVEFHPAYGTA